MSPACTWLHPQQRSSAAGGDDAGGNPTCTALDVYPKWSVEKEAITKLAVVAVHAVLLALAGARHDAAACSRGGCMCAYSVCMRVCMCVFMCVCFSQCVCVCVRVSVHLFDLAMWILHGGSTVYCVRCSLRACVCVFVFMCVCVWVGVHLRAF